MTLRLLRAATACLGLALAAGARPSAAPTSAADLQFVFTSDAHYGITRAAFRGRSDVDAHVVNQALVATINALPGATFPNDGGIGAGTPVGAIDFVAEGGDVANRAESTPTQLQSAAASWAQFSADYLDGLTVTTRSGERSPVFVVPGNHDVSNAVGYPRPMKPATDASSMAAIYNLMMRPAVPLTASTYRYETDHVLTTRDLAGIHFVFVTVWPDSKQRDWLEADLAGVPSSTPVIIVTHDQPDAESKHFTNPNGGHDINATDVFENLLVDQLADGPTTKTPDTIEQRAFEGFLERHPNVTAYFHGNSNWNQFYDWTGPDHTVDLHTFRVDSPMKGDISSKDETKLSFQVASFDASSRTITVRECLWNTNPREATVANPSIVWGGSTTVALSPRPAGR